MPSIQSPAYPPFENLTASLPALPAQRTIDLVWRACTTWPYWGEIQKVAQKEYRISKEAFEQRLPEYQRFLSIIMMGYQGVGMFSGEIDQIWHSHILSTHLYLHFCLTLHGRMINHIPQVSCPHDAHEGGSICRKCQSCVHCSIRCKKCETTVDGPPTLLATTAEQFATAYRQVFNAPPPAIWSGAVAEGCAAG